MKFIDQIPRFTLKMRILVMTHLMVISPPSAKPVLVLSLDFGLIGSEPSLVKIWGIDELLHTLLEVCPAHKDKVEIKCMGSIGGKTPIEPKLYLFISNLRQIEQDEVGKIRRLSMNISFKFIWQKRLSCLTHRKIVYLCHNVSIFT